MNRNDRNVNYNDNRCEFENKKTGAKKPVYLTGTSTVTQY